MSGNNNNNNDLNENNFFSQQTLNENFNELLVDAKKSFWDVLKGFFEGEAFQYFVGQFEAFVEGREQFSAKVASAFLKICEAANGFEDKCERLREYLLLYVTLSDERVGTLGIGSHLYPLNSGGSGGAAQQIFSAHEHLEICEKSKNTLLPDSLRLCVEDMRGEIDNSEALYYADMVLGEDEFNIRHVISFYNCVKIFQSEKKRALKKIQKSFLTLQSLHAFNLKKTFHIATTVSDADADIDDNDDNADDDDDDAAAAATTNLLALSPPKKRQRRPSKLALEAAKSAEKLREELSDDDDGDEYDEEASSNGGGGGGGGGKKRRRYRKRV